MDDDYYLQQRRTEAIERQNYAIEEQNRINATAAQIQAAQLDVARKAAQAQILQNAQMINAMEQQIVATQDTADATREVAATIERGQRAWAEVEMDKMKRRQKKDADKEFTYEQENKIHRLWQRMGELDLPNTPGAKFMLWKELRAERADIAIDSVHQIEYKDRDHEVGVKLRDFIVALATKYPLLAVVAADYPGQIALAQRLQAQPFFRTFEENTDANILLQLRQQFPELNIPNCDTYPQKSYNFVQDVSRLKKLCALLGDAAVKNKGIRTIILSAFNLDPAVFDEEKWTVIVPEEMSSFVAVAGFYYRFYRNRYIYNSSTFAVDLQRILEPLAKFLKIDFDSVTRLRSVEQAKREEIANLNKAIDQELENIAEAKRKAEEEERRQAEEERRRKLKLEKEERQRELELMENKLIDAIFTLLKNHRRSITPCVRFKKEIKLDNTLLACSNDLCIFGNRIHYLYDTNHICVWTWKTLAEQPRKRKSFGYEIIDALGIEFQKAKDVVHPVVGMKSHLTIAVSNPWKYILCGILLTMIPTILIWSVSNWWIAFFSCIILGFVCSIQLMQWYKRNRDKACQELLHTSQIYVFCDNPWCRKIFEE